MRWPTPPIAARVCAVLACVSACLPAAAQQWTELGPAPIANGDYTGRVSAIACSPTNPNLYYVGGADGGVWRTTDGGASWTPLTDHLPSSAIGALALDPANPTILYAGTGEANFANHSRYGLGLYKSTDGGNTWSVLAESVFAGRCFSKIVVDPVNPNVVYASITRAGGFPEMAAAKEHPGRAGDLGVFKSTDGGVNWSRLATLPNRSVTDLVIDPVNSNILYAGVGHIFGDANNGVWKTTNGGTSWTKLAGGFPTTDVGRVSLAIARNNPNRLYALVAGAASASGGGAETRGAFRSDDAGANWTSLPIGNIQATYGWYLNVVSVKPDDPNTAIFGGLTLERTTNAGASFSNITPPHVDMHAIAWDASGRLVVGDDGGVHRSTNLGSSWTSQNDGLGLIQFYAGISTHPTNDLVLFGGTQDNGTNRRTTNSREWTHVLGGDGGWTQLDRANPLRVFAEYQGTGNLFRSTDGGNNYGGASNGINGGDRNCFLPPYLIHPTDSNRMLYATHRVYRSTNGGSSWTAISGDLTDGQGAIRALAQSPADPLVVWAATNDGNVQVSDDEGATWTLVLDNVGGWPRVTRELHAPASDADTCYLAGAVFGAPKVRRTTDRGQTWQTLDGDLPDIPVNVVVEVMRFTNRQIFAGTDAGVWFSGDDGATWRRFGAGLPNAAVIDLVAEAERGRLVAATQGRGAWSAPLFPEPADLANLFIDVGTITSGTIDDLRESDDAHLRTRSGFGRSFIDLHNTTLRVTAVTDVPDPSTIDLSFETRVSAAGGGSARVRLRDWNAGAFVQVGTFPLRTTDETVPITGIDATNFVRESDGLIEIEIRHVVFVPIFAYQFDSFLDLVEAFVN